MLPIGINEVINVAKNELLNKAKNMETVSKDFKETIKTFESIETYGNKDFENIKQIYLDGMNATVEGFNTYINNPSSEDCNKFFLEADDKFYEGQQELKKVLSDYMAN